MKTTSLKLSAKNGRTRRPKESLNITALNNLSLHPDLVGNRAVRTRFFLSLYASVSLKLVTARNLVEEHGFFSLSRW